ncbi:MAG TPA: DUF695 domain-containing protein [Ferruginibacter sp.]|jgi:hypothetical protein|nr:DUF695 domain-containing protein [Ferruginibacter sp.]
MGFFKKIFGSKDEDTVISNYADFWRWFQRHEKTFFKAVKEHEKVDEHFLRRLTPMLRQLSEDFYCVTGMTDDHTAELIISTDGIIREFVFAEEMVAAAPALKSWKFTALKPSTDIDTMGIEMDGHEFNSNNISFFSNDLPDYPDEIDITLVHKDFTEENKDSITSGSLIYLDNLLGEYNTAIMVDIVTVEGPSEGQDLIPIEKLPGYLLWRQKEFVEKYEGVRYGTEEDSYTTMEAEDENGLPVFAIINQDLMNWDAKASHPWMMVVEIKFDGGRQGLPDEGANNLMNEMEDEILKQLPDGDGYLNIGRETYNSVRTIYFACKEFRQASKKVKAVVGQYNGKLSASYDIFKDKYWMSLNHLKPGESL